MRMDVRLTPELIRRVPVFYEPCKAGCGAEIVRETNAGHQTGTCIVEDLPSDDLQRPRAAD
jgi:hypothetical protein